MPTSSQMLLCGEPHQHLVQFLPPDFFCPICSEQGIAVLLKPKGWKDGRVRRLMPRQITGISGRVLLISRVYSCSAGHEINGHDPSVLAMMRTLSFFLTGLALPESYCKCLFVWYEMDSPLPKFTKLCSTGCICDTWNSKAGFWKT